MKPSTEHDYHRRIARVIEAILADPGAPHTVDTLAAIAHLSPFHFHRIYRALTGESIAETVQRLRLAKAAHQLKNAGDSVTSIALDVGYDSPQAFARAFRGFAGISPTEFRARQTDLANPIVADQILADPCVEAASGMPSARPIGASDVEITQLAPIDALCLRHQGPIATIGLTYRKLLRTLDVDETAREGMIGICTGDTEEPGSFHYLAGIAPTAPLEPVGAVEAVRVEGGLYAAYRLVGPWALIAPTFRTLFGGWLPQSGYDPDDRPALELYRHRSTPDARQECVTDLLIPIRRR
jgi:AraC family transcriptional regulator